MTPQEEIKRGEASKQLLENPLFKSAINEVREGVIRSIANSPMGDEKTHNRLAIALQLLNQIEKNLMTHIETGKLAQITVEEKRGLRRVFG